MKHFPAAIATALIAHAAFVACSRDGKFGYTDNIDPESDPTMTTRDVRTLISDSGITKYRIITPLWLVYDEASEPLWRFPNTLNLEKFDNDLNVEATVECDSAIYLKNKQLWQLDGNVRIANTLNERFLTEQLFWDQKKHTVYSDSFIHVERADRTLEGYGFTANEAMTSYKIHRVSGIFPANSLRKDPAAATDSAKPAADSRPTTTTQPATSASKPATAPKTPPSAPGKSTPPAPKAPPTRPADPLPLPRNP